MSDHPRAGRARHWPTRLAAAGAAVLTVAAGLGIRALASNEATKYAGDALYTVMVYALIVVLVPRAKHLWVAVGAFGFSTAIEFFKLSGVSPELARHSTAARLVLGTTFNPPNVLWYAAGTAVAWLVHRSWTRAASTTTPASTASTTTRPSKATGSSAPADGEPGPSR